MVNDLVSTWPKCAKYVDDLTILEIIPRNCPSYLNCIVDDRQCFSHRNNMGLNPAKCKAMTIDFLQTLPVGCKTPWRLAQSSQFRQLHVKKILKVNWKIFPFFSLKHNKVSSKNWVAANYEVPRSRKTYSRTSLIRTPKGQSKVSVLERCPYKRGHYDDVTFMTPITVLSVQ